MFPFFQAIPGDTQVKELVNQSLLVNTQSYNESMVVSVGPMGEYGYPLTHARVPRLRPQLMTHSRGGRIADACGGLLKTTEAIEVIPIPPVRWVGRGEPRRFRLPVTIILALGMAAVFLAWGGVWGAAMALPAAALTALVTWRAMRAKLPVRILTAGNLHLDGTNIVDYTVARQIGERPERLTDEQRRTDIVGRIEEILQEYGRLKLDIGYRIENSALFDSAAPTTHSFEVALVRYDTQSAGLSLDQLDELATELEITYSVARDHAETVGLSHLPATAQADARRAAKAVRLAEGAATDAEREAAMDQVVRILESLALYYLPAPEGVRRQITDGSTPGD
ncbi:hypothetical protein GCM10028820_23820 [Tessaracoccus terricola]